MDDRDVRVFVAMQAWPTAAKSFKPCPDVNILNDRARAIAESMHGWITELEPEDQAIVVDDMMSGEEMLGFPDWKGGGVLPSQIPGGLYTINKVEEDDT